MLRCYYFLYAEWQQRSFPLPSLFSLQSCLSDFLSLSPLFDAMLSMLYMKIFFLPKWTSYYWQQNRALDKDSKKGFSFAVGRSQAEIFKLLHFCFILREKSVTKGVTKGYAKLFFQKPVDLFFYHQAFTRCIILYMYEEGEMAVFFLLFQPAFLSLQFAMFLRSLY